MNGISLALARTTIVMAAWAVEQDSLNRHVDQLPELYRPPILKAINSMFESLDAHAVLATATLDTALYRSGETDRTDDIGL